MQILQIAVAESSDWMTAAAAADTLHVSRQTIKNWIAAGKLPGAKRTPGGYWLIPATSIDAAIEELAAADRVVVARNVG